MRIRNYQVRKGDVLLFFATTAWVVVVVIIFIVGFTITATLE